MEQRPICIKNRPPSIGELHEDIRSILRGVLRGLAGYYRHRRRVARERASMAALTAHERRDVGLDRPRHGEVDRRLRLIVDLRPVV
jgi:hypothetical protein